MCLCLLAKWSFKYLKLAYWQYNEIGERANYVWVTLSRKYIYPIPYLSSNTDVIMSGVEFSFKVTKCLLLVSSKYILFINSFQNSSTNIDSLR